MTLYAETPENYNEISKEVLSDVETIKGVFLSADQVYFYDACSFQRHAHLRAGEKDKIIRFFKNHNAIIVITRCILMELATNRHKLSREYIEFIKSLNDANVKVVILNEEYIYDIMAECFSTNEAINEYLVWAVRIVKTPISSITEALNEDEKLKARAVEGKSIKQSDLYCRFFSSVRNHKERDDNLGEEMIALCVHILSHLPGVPNGKLCVVTDDKHAAGKIDSVMKGTNPKNRGADIVLFSTPKLLQHMFRENIEMTDTEMAAILSQGISGKIVVMGITPYDLSVNEKISLTIEDLVRKIKEPNGINIVF